VKKRGKLPNVRVKATTATPACRPLSALLSQALVAYTVELDNNFELGMSRAGFPGARLSLVVWTNLLRFIPEKDGISVRDLQTTSLGSEDRLRFQLGCLERWGFIYFQQGRNDPAGSQMRSEVKRDGWGSGRGIKQTWVVHLARRGRLAVSIWPKVWPEAEERWKQRFGAGYAKLYGALQEIEQNRELELPLGLPGGGNVPWSEVYPPRKSQGEEAADIPLSALLSRVLLMFTIEFDQRSGVPITLCANTIRVLNDYTGVRLGDLPRLTGCPPEASDIGWFLKRFVVVESDPSGKRGKVAKLSPAGLKTQKAYYQLTSEIEKEWEGKFGATRVRALRSALEAILALQKDGKSVLGQGMVPPEGVIRAGSVAPALGRRDPGAAARQRGRDSVEQTKLFIADPEGSLPHYPMWDMNRGFGP
jgi:hypothetical protein